MRICRIANKLAIGIFFTILFSQEICDEFQITSIYFNPETEWGNLLFFHLDIPDTSIYAPYFYLQTDDEFVQITDSIYSYFWVTGPTNIDLLYNFEYDSIPNNHPFSGLILMVSGDNLLECEFLFEFIINEQINVGDINLDTEVNVLDIIYLVNYIIYFSDFTEQQIALADLNQDQIINVIDILIIVDIILLA